MPRPNVPDRLIKEVESLHEDRQEYEAGSFQEALATVIDMATPELVEEMGLLVAKAYPDDSGRNVARLHQDALQQLDIQSGRPIEIIGNKITVAIVKELKKTDLNPATMRIDGFTRENTGTDVGDCVRVRRAEGISYADQATFKLPKKGVEELGTRASGVVQRQVRDRYVSIGDIVPVMADPETGGPAIPFTVTETEPDGPVGIRDSTEVILTAPDQS